MAQSLRRYPPWSSSTRCLSTKPAQRRERSIQRRIDEAKFRDLGTLENFDWTFNAQTIDRARFEELATGEFVRRGENLVKVGQSGLGQSHLIQGVGRKLCVVGYRVRYVTSADLVQDLAASRADATLAKRLRFYRNFDLLIIDEFGFEKLERLDCPQAANLFYKVIEARYPHRSTAPVTNVDFKAWSDYLGDPPLAMAFLDRLVDGAIVMKLEGDSYRTSCPTHQRQSQTFGTDVSCTLSRNTCRESTILRCVPPSRWPRCWNSSSTSRPIGTVLNCADHASFTIRWVKVIDAACRSTWHAAASAASVARPKAINSISGGSLTGSPSLRRPSISVDTPRYRYPR